MIWMGHAACGTRCAALSTEALTEFDHRVPRTARRAPHAAYRAPHTACRLVTPRLPEQYIPHRFPEIPEIGIDRMFIVLI